MYFLSPVDNVRTLKGKETCSPQAHLLVFRTCLDAKGFWLPWGWLANPPSTLLKPISYCRWKYESLCFNQCPVLCDDFQNFSYSSMRILLNMPCTARDICSVLHYNVCCNFACADYWYMYMYDLCIIVCAFDMFNKSCLLTYFPAFTDELSGYICAFFSLMWRNLPPLTGSDIADSLCVVWVCVCFVSSQTDWQMPRPRNWVPRPWTWSFRSCTQVIFAQILT